MTSASTCRETVGKGCGSPKHWPQEVVAPETLTTARRSGCREYRDLRSCRRESWLSMTLLNQRSLWPVDHEVSLRYCVKKRAQPKGVFIRKKSASLFICSAMVAALAFASPASASGGTFNCGPTLRLKIYTNLGPNPANINHTVDGISIGSAFATTLTSCKTQSSGSWGATPSGSKSCVV